MDYKWILAVLEMEKDLVSAQIQLDVFKFGLETIFFVFMRHLINLITKKMDTQDSPSGLSSVNISKG